MREMGARLADARHLLARIRPHGRNRSEVSSAPVHTESPHELVIKTGLLRQLEQTGLFRRDSQGTTITFERVTEEMPAGESSRNYFRVRETVGTPPDGFEGYSASFDYYPNQGVLTGFDSKYHPVRIQLTPAQRDAVGNVPWRLIPDTTPHRRWFDPE